MYLILDFGNTLVKEFLYQKETLVASTVIPYKTLSAALLATQKKHPKITHILVSDVWGKGVLVTIYNHIHFTIFIVSKIFKIINTAYFVEKFN